MEKEDIETKGIEEKEELDIKDSKKESRKSKEEPRENINENDYENKIKSSVKNVLERKIRESGYWTEEQLAAIPNTMECQLSITSDHILDMAKGRVKENKDPKNQERYLKKLKRCSIDIAENETMVNPNFDMETAIKREADIREKVEKGELTPEEALREYEKPIPDLNGKTLGQLRTLGGKDYQQIYQEEMQKRQRRNKKEKSFREDLKEGAPSLEEQAENVKRFQKQADKFSGKDQIEGKEVAD